MNEEARQKLKIQFVKSNEAKWFLRHIKEHIANGETGDINHEPKCKICDKTISEISEDTLDEINREIMSSGK